ncbi:heme-binding protein [Peribacillus loiseleuriae]|uniref:heme-binding protein n=1 Tax=Peribacillus loiseleuriae TaxID=1679170 RepID=UPI00380E5912
MKKVFISLWGCTSGGDAYDQGKIILLGGSIPFVIEGKIVGGIGASEGTSQQDIEEKDG